MNQYAVLPGENWKWQQWPKKNKKIKQIVTLYLIHVLLFSIKYHLRVFTHCVNKKI